MATGGALIGALRVTLGLDSAQFEHGTKRARNIAKRDVGEIQKIMGGVKTAFAGLATAATASAFAGAAKRALDYAGGLGELAQSAGISTRALQEYAAIGVDVGLTNDDVASSFARLSKTIGQAQDGDKKASETFRQLGIDVKGLTAEDAMPKLIAAFEQIKSPTDQARLAADLFGRTAGAKLLPLLNMTSDGFEKARQSAHDLGLVLSEDAIASADAASDAIAKLTKVVEVNFAAAMSTGADGTAAFASELARMVARLPDQVRELQKFTAAAAQGLRAFGPIGQAGANMASRQFSYLLDDKQFQKQLRDTAKRVRANPNDKGLAEYGEFLTQQAADRVAARRSSSAPAATGGGLEPRTDRGTGGGKKGGRGERGRTAEYLERFNREMEGLRDEQLQLTIDQTASLDERAQLEAQRILNERAAYTIEIDNRVKAGELNTAQAEKLKLAIDQIAADKQAIMFKETEAKKLAEKQRLDEVAFDAREEAMRLELDSARTQGERRNIELRMLDLEYEREKAALAHLNALLELGKATFAEVDEAEKRVAAMQGARGGREAAIRRNTMGPMEQYLDGLPKSVDELNEAMERAAVEGLGDLKAGLSDVLLRGENVFDALGNAADRFMEKLLDMALDDAFAALFGKGGNGGSGGGGILSALGSLFGGGKGGGYADFTGYKFNGLPGAATGGSFMVGGNPGVDRNVLSLNGIGKVRVSSGEKVTINKPGQGGEAQSVQIVP
ncbi:MAG: hypothetical protein EOP58_01680, partial [Sphingomonadales bacterium]